MVGKGCVSPCLDWICAAMFLAYKLIEKGLLVVNLTVVLLDFSVHTKTGKIYTKSTAVQLSLNSSFNINFCYYVSELLRYGSPNLCPANRPLKRTI